MLGCTGVRESISDLKNCLKGAKFKLGCKIVFFIRRSHSTDET